LWAVVPEVFRGFALLASGTDPRKAVEKSSDPFMKIRDICVDVEVEIDPPTRAPLLRLKS
jgi:hypothetical protein